VPGLLCWCISCDPVGDSLQLLAVADGHGGERYRHSDAGSRLACQEAAAAVSAALQSTPLDQTRAWQQLLQEGLPAAIQTRWLEAIQRHWQQQHQQGVDHEPFCSSLYGSTLGLLLLAPRGGDALVLATGIWCVSAAVTTVCSVRRPALWAQVRPRPASA
jgi:hypothetical protein